MAVSKRLRYEVLRRDNHACRYCGRTAPEVELTVDHVVPVSLGGSDDPKNLVAACRDCNGGKTSSNPDAPLVESVGDDALRWSQAMRRAASEIAAHDDRVEDILDAVQDAWKPYYQPADWAASVVTFIKAGLSEDDLLAMVRVAYAKRGIGSSGRWAYFCGCCWSRIRQYQDRAAEIVAQQSPDPTPPQFEITTRWTQADFDYCLSLEAAPLNWIGPLLECEDHNDGKCEQDMLCQVVSASRTREVIEQASIRKSHKRRNADLINDAADEAEDCVYG